MNTSDVNLLCDVWEYCMYTCTFLCVRKCAHVVIALSLPCVLCRDGTGRSGAFAQIVSQIERMKVEGTVDYFQSIKLARIQRAHLVYSQVLADM